MRSPPLARRIALTLGLAIALGTGGRALAEPSAADTLVQRFTISPRSTPSAMRIDLGSADGVLASWTDHAVAVLEGPGHAKTWPLGPSGRAVLIATTDDKGRRTARVLAVEEGCEWREPRVSFEEVRAGTATFAFTRETPEAPAVPLRWEASAAGVRVQRAGARDWYQARSRAARRELEEIVARASDCAQTARRDGPRAAELATAIYVWSIAAGADATQAHARLVADLATAPECTLALVSSLAWRSEAEVGAMAITQGLVEGRFDTHQDAAREAVCNEAPATVELHRTSTVAPASNAAATVAPPASPFLPY